MSFLTPRNPLIPRAGLGMARVDPAVRVLRGTDHVAWASGQELLAHVRQQAEAIVQQATAAFEAERQRGYEDGWESALLDQAVKITETAVCTLEHFSGVEDEIMNLVMAAVRKLIDGFDDRERVLIVVRNALAVVRNQKQMVLRLNPAEVDVVRRQISDLLSPYPVAGYLDVLPDERLACGQCVLESEMGIVEASLDGQFQVLERAFLHMAKRRSLR